MRSAKDMTARPVASLQLRDEERAGPGGGRGSETPLQKDHRQSSASGENVHNNRCGRPPLFMRLSHNLKTFLAPPALKARTAHPGRQVRGCPLKIPTQDYFLLLWPFPFVSVSLVCEPDCPFHGPHYNFTSKHFPRNWAVSSCRK